MIFLGSIGIGRFTNNSADKWRMRIAKEEARIQTQHSDSDFFDLGGGGGGVELVFLFSFLW